MLLRGMRDKLILSIATSFITVLFIATELLGSDSNSFMSSQQFVEKDMTVEFPTYEDFHRSIYAWQPNMVPHSIVAYMDYDHNGTVDEALVFPYYSMNRLRGCDPEHRIKVKKNHLKFSVCDMPNSEQYSQPYEYITQTIGWVCGTCVYEKLFGRLSVIPVVTEVGYGE
jgi:hypothetical protein